jgi:hypothetical protein
VLVGIADTEIGRELVREVVREMAEERQGVGVDRIIALELRQAGARVAQVLRGAYVVSWSM